MSGADLKTSAPVSPSETVRRLYPRKKLFVGLLLVWVAWAVALLVMYFQTVAPAGRMPSSVSDVTRR